MSISMAIVILLLFFPQFGLVEYAYATGGQDLQALIDQTPSGGILTLSSDFTGKTDSRGYDESVNITKPITITGPSGGHIKIDWIRFNIRSDNVSFKNLLFEKNDTVGGVINNTHVSPIIKRIKT